jgi:hypothetical protein
MIADSVFDSSAGSGEKEPVSILNYLGRSKQVPLHSSYFVINNLQRK